MLYLLTVFAKRFTISGTLIRRSKCIATEILAFY